MISRVRRFNWVTNHVSPTADSFSQLVHQESDGFVYIQSIDDIHDWSVLVGSWCLIFTVALVHALVPHARRYTKLFYKLQYHDVTGRFLQGFNDIYFVLAWVVLLTAIRATIIASTYQLTTRLNLVSGKARVRFSEQSWLLFYDGISFSLGMVSSCLMPYTKTMADFISVYLHVLLILAWLSETLVWMAHQTDDRAT